MISKARERGFKALTFAVLTMITLPAPAQPPLPEDTVDNEILITIRSGPGHPLAADVVSAVNEGRSPVPGNLGAGDPQRAEFVVLNRARGAAAERLLDNPDLPRARLERTFVLHYPSVNAIPGLLQGLSANPHVEFALQNQPLRFHSATGRSLATKAVEPDDLFFGPEGSDPRGYQWGSFMLRFPEAWEYVEGHAMVALLDRGIQPGHFDLEPFDDSGSLPVFLGGNFRENYSFDYIGEDCDVDEKKDPATDLASHGTHVTGIVGATPNNGEGVAGGCWNCPIAMAKIWEQGQAAGLDDAARAIIDMVDKGVQVISMSFGVPHGCDSPLASGPLCDALTVASNRDVLVVAAAGNDRNNVVDFPASDLRVVAVGGINPDGTFWDEWPDCPFGFRNALECGSNFGPELEFVGPAKWILSTVYTNTNSNEKVGCGDSFGAVGTDSDGLGLCTGTSMATPYIAVAGALPRTSNPLLTQDQIRQLMRFLASLGGAFNEQLGFGIPDVGATVRDSMGRVGGQVLRNRLSPFFALFSSLRAAHLYTTSPQRAAVAVIGMDGSPFLPIGPAVPSYSSFPGVPGTPRASVFLFTTPHKPVGQSFELLPLFRMSKDPNRLFLCTGTVDPGAKWSFAYARNADEILSFRSEGYAIDGIEGYIIDASGPLPTGSVLLHRLYNFALDDWVVVPDSEVSSLPAGYAPRAGFSQVVGAVFPNVDSDGDSVIDGFEAMAGINPFNPDSDGDGINDGDELLGYTGATPSGVLGDPLCSEKACLFADSFESGNTTRWSFIIQ